MNWDHAVTLAPRAGMFAQLRLATTRADLDAIRAAGYRPGGCDTSSLHDSGSTGGAT